MCVSHKKLQVTHTHTHTKTEEFKGFSALGDDTDSDEAPSPVAAAAADDEEVPGAAAGAAADDEGVAVVVVDGDSSNGHDGGSDKAGAMDVQSDDEKTQGEGEDEDDWELVEERDLKMPFGQRDNSPVKKKINK